MWAARPPGLPSEPGNSRGSIFGVFGGAGVWSPADVGSRLLVSVGPISHHLVSPVSSHPVFSKGYPQIFRVYFLVTHLSSSVEH